MKYVRLTDAEFARVEQQGRTAHRQGRRLGDCPYNRHDNGLCRRRAIAWTSGWCSAENEATPPPAVSVVTLGASS